MDILEEDAINPQGFGPFDIFFDIVDKYCFLWSRKKMRKRHSVNGWMRFSHSGFIGKPNAVKIRKAGIFRFDVRGMNRIGVGNNSQLVISFKMGNKVDHFDILIKYVAKYFDKRLKRQIFEAAGF